MSDTGQDLDWLNGVLTGIAMERNDVRFWSLESCLMIAMLGGIKVFQPERCCALGAPRERSHVSLRPRRW